MPPLANKSPLHAWMTVPKPYSTGREPCAFTLGAFPAPQISHGHDPSLQAKSLASLLKCVCSTAPPAIYSVPYGQAGASSAWAQYNRSDVNLT